jgi:hypothetical protein
MGPDDGKTAAAGRGRLRGLVFDANENYFYHWIALISTAYVYNLLVRA